MALETKKFNALIKSITSNAAAQRKLIQSALISIAVYAQRDGRHQPAEQLMAAIGTGVYRAGISKWLSLNAPIHFKNDEPLLSKDRRNEKQAEVGFTIEQYELDISAMPAWYDIDRDNNKTPNVWDSVAFADTLKKHMFKALGTAQKHDAALAGAIDKAYARFLSELATLEVKEEETIEV